MPKYGLDYSPLSDSIQVGRINKADDTLGANYEAINRMCEILFPDTAEATS